MASGATREEFVQRGLALRDASDLEEFSERCGEFLRMFPRATRWLKWFLMPQIAPALFPVTGTEFP